MSNNRGSVSQKSHHSGQLRGSQSQGHHNSKAFLGIKGGGGGGNPVPQKKNQQQPRFNPKKNFIKN